MASSKLNKELYTDITRLKLLNRNGAEIRFRLQKSPFPDDDDDDALIAAQKLDEYVVTGHIFPESEIFRERSYLIEMRLTKSYPMTPPVVRFLTPIYHPNVDQNGNFCNDLLLLGGKWTPDTSLIKVLKAVVKHIDEPNIDYAASLELGKQYQDHRAEFNRKALEYVEKHGLPR